jgi:transposase
MRKDGMPQNRKSTAVDRKERKQSAQLKPQDWTLGLKIVHPKAAGIDVGNQEHWVAVPPSMDEKPVRAFGCFTAELEAMGDWLVSLGIETAALQSTGVYWIPLYDILEQRGIRVFLVNAQDTKNLPGRKTDVQESQWLLKLHVYGLLKNSFRPEEEIYVMRTYWRQRQQHIGDASRCIQRMQKVLTQMNVQLANVISDISGETGQAILRAILKGERDARKLGQLRDARIKASEAAVAASLEGNWREELLFILKQEYESYQTFQKKMRECDRRLFKHYRAMEAKGDPGELAERGRNKRPRGNAPVFDLRAELYRAIGVDLTAIDGINVVTAQTLVAEVGCDMSRFETEAHFVSFLDLSPKNKISGGKVIGREKRKTKNRAGMALRLASGTLLNSQTYLGAQYRRLRTKLGTPKARKAMAAKMARLAYRLMKYGEAYVDKGNQFYEERYRQQQIRMLSKKATELGLQVVACA